MRLWIKGIALSALAILAACSSAHRPSPPSPTARAGAFSGFGPCPSGGADRYPAPAACGVLVVAEDRARPESRRLALPVVRLRGPGAAPRGAPVLFLNGGPGGSNLGFKLKVTGLLAAHDVLLVGYRGVDDAEPLACPEVERAITVAAPLSDQGRAGMAASAHACAARLAARGIDLRRYTIFDVVEDLEDARRAIGAPAVALLSRSYGTRVAQDYARLHPAAVARSAMFGVNPPGHFRWFPPVTDAVLDRYGALCAADAGCRARTPDLAGAVRRQLNRSDHAWLGLPIRRDKVEVAGFFLLTSRSTAVYLFDAVQAAEHGDDSGLWLVAQAYDLILPRTIVWGDMMAKGGGDDLAHGDCDPASPFVAARRPSATTLGSPMDLLLAGTCAGWPVVAAPPAFDAPARDETPTLLVNGELDVATPLVFGRDELLPQLPHGRLVTLDAYGHGDWAERQQPALDRLLTRFLADGAIDASLYAADPVPFRVAWGAPTVAKIAVGVAAGLVALCGLGIWLTARLIRRRRAGAGPRPRPASRPGGPAPGPGRR
jgi:pimeloyl-ACP methyl ester carboxylesterase